MKEILAIIIFASILVFSTYNAIDIIISEESNQDKVHAIPEGLQCVYYKQNLSCNWDAWNEKTNFGMYPYPLEKK